MAQLAPILVANLFPEISEHLVSLLRSLAAEEWHLPTASSGRDVKDIASHLLDGSIRRLSMQRDGYRSPDAPTSFASYQDVVDYLNRANAEWTTATRRISPRILVQFLDETGRELADLMERLDPFAPALFSVAWAGQSESLNWFDIAREYTEKWHHTQQIFEATGRPSTISTRRLFYPCLDTFMRALPFTYRHVIAPEGATVLVAVRGDAGGEWHLRRENNEWEQVSEGTTPPTATATLDQLTAWRVFTKRMARDTVLARFPDIEIQGDVALASHVLDTVAMMA